MMSTLAGTNSRPATPTLALEGNGGGGTGVGVGGTGVGVGGTGVAVGGTGVGGTGVAVAAGSVAVAAGFVAVAVAPAAVAEADGGVCDAAAGAVAFVLVAKAVLVGELLAWAEGEGTAADDGGTVGASEEEPPQAAARIASPPRAGNAMNRIGNRKGFLLFVYLQRRPASRGGGLRHPPDVPDSPCSSPALFAGLPGVYTVKAGQAYSCMTAESLCVYVPPPALDDGDGLARSGRRGAGLSFSCGHAAGTAADGVIEAASPVSPIAGGGRRTIVC